MKIDLEFNEKRSGKLGALPYLLVALKGDYRTAEEADVCLSLLESHKWDYNLVKMRYVLQQEETINVLGKDMSKQLADMLHDKIEQIEAPNLTDSEKLEKLNVMLHQFDTVEDVDFKNFNKVVKTLDI